MQNSFKSKIVAGGLAVAIMTLPAITAFAAEYTSYALPPRQGNNYTGSHEKKTTDQHIVNYVREITHTDTATFWACDAVKTQISNDYDQKKGNTSKIQFRNDVSKGSDVIMGMQNASWHLYQNGFVSGDVDFR